MRPSVGGVIGSTSLVIGAVVLAFAQGCAVHIPREAFAMNESAVEIRQRSSRWFDTRDEAGILTASAELLQDLGFTIEQSEAGLGLIVASKDRSAVEGGQVARKMMTKMFFGTNVAIDKNQRFRASLVSRPVRGGVVVRVTFQRTVWNDKGQVSHFERLDDAREYQQFFDLLAKSVFLEAQKI